MPLIYSVWQERHVEDLDREAPIEDFPVRKATFDWPPSMYVLVNQLVMAASAEIGSTTRSELVASAAARLGPAALSGDDLDDRLRAYRKSSTDDLLRDPIDPEAAEKLPRHSGLTLPEPLHILLKEIQYVSLSHPKQSEIAGLAVSELAQAGDSAAGEAVMSYRKATVGDLFSDHSA